jgi:hypothetical protein
MIVISYSLLGQLFIFIIAGILVVIQLALIFGIYSFKTRRILFSGFVILILSFFYAPAKWICRLFHIKETIVDEILIELQNASMFEKFKKVKDHKAIIAPQCMRHPNCRARLDPVLGYVCIECGLCDLGILKHEGRKYGYELFIIPGDSFVKKILRAYQPKACLGIACFSELTESMIATSKHMPVQGLALSIDGCYDTKVDVSEVIERIKQ